MDPIITTLGIIFFGPIVAILVLSAFQRLFTGGGKEQ